jgi:response regulator RpfG family c-di-GMP phosphodiesterase
MHGIAIKSVRSINGMNNIQQLTYNHSNNNERKKKTIMICDDERDVLVLFGLVFGSKYHVIMADSGEECIDRFMEEKNRGYKVHLILLDYRLGDMMVELI